MKAARRAFLPFDKKKGFRGRCLGGLFGELYGAVQCLSETRHDLIDALAYAVEGLFGAAVAYVVQSPRGGVDRRGRARENPRREVHARASGKPHGSKVDADGTE